ncbi:MAG TPA: hypothetical protein VNX46_05415 [Candidatus Acidoferrum sp.]|nr:hypothetical protein [Candidatus Acidoferrum sp.]
MASAAQIAANRLNARKSTGPRTAAGKAVSSRNAEKHGKFSRAPLVSSQSHQESSSEVSTQTTLSPAICRPPACRADLSAIPSAIALATAEAPTATAEALTKADGLPVK